MAFQVKRQNKISRYLLGKIRFLAHWRCVEPVIVFESDDWGFNRKASASLLKKYGNPSPWADEQIETEEDLDALYRVLEQYRDPNGRPACFVANFIVSMPDYDTIIKSRYIDYSDIPLSQFISPALMEKYREGLARKVFFPSYHGRSHFCPDLWLDDLRNNVPGARDLASAHCLGGLSLLQGQGWRYHSEYLNWRKGDQKAFPELFKWLSEGLQFFQAMFGYSPKDTIAPHYISTPRSRLVLKAAGIRYLQGMNYRLIRLKNGDIGTISSALGEITSEGLVCITRNIKFEPRPQRPANHLPSAWQQIEFAMQHHIPAIVDTHRINYSGAWREQSLAALSNLLVKLEKYKPVILTTAELGQAIMNNGVYSDIFCNKLLSFNIINLHNKKLFNYLLNRYNNIY